VVCGLLAPRSFALAPAASAAAVEDTPLATECDAVRCASPRAASLYLTAVSHQLRQLASVLGGESVPGTLTESALVHARTCEVGAGALARQRRALLPAVFPSAAAPCLMAAVALRQAFMDGPQQATRAAQETGTRPRAVAAE
jgi:hypothetical protein